MTTQTEALKLALEALEEIHVGNMTPMAEANWNKAITAIKEALAQQSNEQVEPVASCNGMPVYEGELSKTQRKQLMQDFDAPLTLNGVALYPLSKEPVGEVILYTGDGFPCAPFHQVKWRDGMMPPDGTKLYTHQPVPTAQPKSYFKFRECEDSQAGQPKEPEQEPVAWRSIIPPEKHTDPFESARVLDFNSGWNECRHSVLQTLDSISTPPQLKEPEQEHIAWAMTYIEKMLEKVPAHSLLASQVFHSLRVELNDHHPKEPEQEPASDAVRDCVRAAAETFSAIRDESQHCDVCHAFERASNWWDNWRGGEHYYTTPSQLKAQPEQKPVAYRYMDINEPELGFWFDEEPSNVSYLQCEPLYTTPPQRKPLTDEQRRAIIQMVATVGQAIDMVEAAHGIKE